MVKGHGKSSATSATRKKHAKKLVGPAQDDILPGEKRAKNKDKSKKKEPRPKMYIPPVKPAPIQPDPLETSGLAHTLPPDLLVVLRSFNKKAQLTKIRALEELQVGWIDKCRDDDELVGVVVEMLPVWFHHVSALFVHPSRRVRSLTASLHASLIQLPVVRDQMFFLLTESASPSQQESLLGSWCMAAHDIDRSIAASALRSWKAALSYPGDPQADQKHLLLDDRLWSSLLSFIQRAALDPSGIYQYLNPTPPVAPSPAPGRGSGKPNLTATSWKGDTEPTSRSKGDEMDEGEQDRGARLRIGAFGALRWALETSSTIAEVFITFLSNPALWTALYHGPACPWLEIESFGFSQPNVRKSAWALIQTLLTSHKDSIESLVPILSTAILRSAWVEIDQNVHASMWQPLLTFLKRYPKCWEMDRFRETEQHNQDDSNSDSENDSESGKKEGLITNTNAKSLAYQEFLQFLQLGCSGSPLQGYPTVVIVISTIPSLIFASASSSLPLDDFFIAFWAALDGHALSSLNRAAASAAFLSSLFECMTFLLRRIRSDNSNHQKGLLLGMSSSVEDVCNELVTTQLPKVWEELTSQRLKVADKAAGQMLGQTFETFQEIGLFDITWSALSMAIKSSYDTNPIFVSVVIKVLHDRFKEGTVAKAAAASLVNETLNTAMIFCEQLIAINGGEGVDAHRQSSELLVNLLNQFGEALFRDEAISKRLDSLITQNAYLLTILSPSLVLSYLHHRQNDAHCLGLWHSLLDGLCKNQISFRKSVAPILDAAQKGLLPNYLTPKSDELDVIVGKLLTEALCGHGVSSDLILVRHILLSSSYFLSKTGYSALLQSIASAFDVQFDILLQGKEVLLSTFQAPLDLIASVFKSRHPNNGTLGEILISKLPNIFIFAYLLPECSGFDDHSTFAVAKSIWTEWLETSSDERKVSVTEVIKAQLRAFVHDTGALPSPEEILKMTSQHPPGLCINLLTDIFPSETEMEEMLDKLSPDSIDPSIAVLDPIVPPSAVKRSPIVAADSRGFSSYARVTNALLHILIEDRTLLKQNIWTLRHFIALSLYAHDLQRVPSANSPAFEPKALTSALSDIIVKVEQVTTYILRSSSDDRWQSEALNNILLDKNDKHVDSPNHLSRALFEIINFSRNRDTTRDCRVLKTVLNYVLDDVDKAEGGLWVQLARKYEKHAPETAMTILYAISESGAEPSQLDRYRNEVAASLLGIQANKANSTGLLALRRLASTAPDPESDVIFLPDLRAVNVVKACQQWIASDEDIDEEVESAMTGIFLHLAPIVQNVPGAHWDFIFDVLESVLENSSITEDSSLVALARGLKLIIVIQDLASTNKSFRSAWQERQLSVLTTVKDLATTRPDAGGTSSPRSACRELILSIVQDLPGSLIDQDTLPKMCHLITDPSKDVQKMAYQLLHAASRKRTEYLVIEAGVDSEAAFEARLPAELLGILDRKMNFDQLDEDEEQNIFGYFLGWMLLFDLFQDASFKVRSSYIEQLRNLNIISTHFLPAFLRLLRLDEGLIKAFKLDIWAIDEYYIELYEPGTPFSVSLFAAHLFYRALLTVPSLIHSWVLDCKDRQLITAVTSYTSQHFSPVLIHAELAHVKSPASQAELVDESLSIKVATAVNEVIASYLVDEHQLEIKLKIPSDWPLHKIEVRDMKRVGVDENRWRAWVLAVQQIIWSHNGRIVDGLGLFKKNVTLHFEGQVECAICYSIISVMDGSLPRKPCKTCKNRFHAGCLYKWFNTSHSSSCPLCRSDII